MRRDDRDRVEQRPCLTAQPCGPRVHRFPHSRRDTAVSGSADFGHEEWVAACDPVELARVDAVRLGELRDSLERERREWHSRERESRCHLAEHDPDGMPRIQRLVAVAQDDEHRGRRDPAGHQPEHVERRLVGPVKILHHHHRRFAPAQFVDQRRCDLVGDRLTPKLFGELRPDLPGEVLNRSQGSGREQRVARTSEHPCRARQVSAEPVDQRRLAATSLSGDEHHAPLPHGNISQRSPEGGQVTLTLREPIDMRL